MAVDTPTSTAAPPGVRQARDTPLAEKIDLRGIIPPFNPQLDVVHAPAGFGTGQIWHVGPKEQYKKPSDVAALVHDGDIVEIDAARYACDTGVKWSAQYLTLLGVGGRPVIDANGCGVVGDKGIWNPRGDGLIVDNIEFAGAAGPSHNDAGIRYDGTGYLYVTRSYFHNDENGILVTSSASAANDVVLDHCEFAHNGVGDGRTHNIYISGGPRVANSFVIRFSYSHDARVGHEVKTRALTNYIVYNRLADEENGDSSYDVDVPQGGLTYIIGNIIQHSSRAENAAMVAYSAEDTHNPDQEVYVVGNTFVSEIPKRGVAVNLHDNGLQTAKMIDNLVVGVSPDNLVGISPQKMSLSNNVVTDAPAFYDQAQREYHLTAASPAVHAGVDPGVAHGVPLAPAYEFTFPAGGVPRPNTGTLDVGAYQYESGQKISPPPKVEFNAQSPVDYGATSTLSWTGADALTCRASGEWFGSLGSSGQYKTPPLESRHTYDISCIGPGGISSRSLTVDVNESPAAAALGTYHWREIPDSALKSVCASNITDAHGNFVYKDDFGTGPYCEGKGSSATGVYVPLTHTWYLVGGAGGRNYYGNEIYGFNLNTLKPELVTVPDHIAATEEYAPGDAYNSIVHIASCDAALHLKTGGIVPAASGVFGTAAWDPQIGQIVVGPGTFVKGSQGCTVTVGGSAEAGQMTTSIWGFTPPPIDSALPVDSAAAWHLLAPANNAFGSVVIPLWFFDPVTGLLYVAGNRNYADRGGFLVDLEARPAKSKLVNSSWPYGADIVGASAIDPDHHYAMIISEGAIAMWNLNELSLSKYSSSASFNHDPAWTIRGSRDLLDDPHHPGITYNPKLKAFVAWTGSSVIYFLYPNYKSRTIDIVAKMDIPPGPTESANDLDGKFIYIPDMDAYLAFSGVNENFFLLTPVPDSATATAHSTSRDTSPKPP